MTEYSKSTGYRETLHGIDLLIRKIFKVVRLKNGKK